MTTTEYGSSRDQKPLDQKTMKSTPTLLTTALEFSQKELAKSQLESSYTPVVSQLTTFQLVA